MITAGIDAGAYYTKAVILDGNKEVGRACVPSGFSFAESTKESFEKALKMASLAATDVAAVAGTGIGVKMISLSGRNSSEVVCQVKAMNQLIPQAKLIIDVGGLDVRGIRVNQGKADFVYNDKCATRLGRFFEELAHQFDVDMEGLSELYFSAQRKSRISSTCINYAHSEIISELAQGRSRDEIVAGLFSGFADRLIAILSKFNLERDTVVLTAGVANIRGFRHALESRLGFEVIVPENPQFTCALGAGLRAREQVERPSTSPGI